MGLETATYLSGLITANPLGGDDRSTADDHLRLIKTVLKNSFPNIGAAVNPTPTEFNRLVGVTSAIQTQLDGKQASGSYLLTSGKAADSELLDNKDSALFGQLALFGLYTTQQQYSPLALTDVATISWDLNRPFATVTLGASRILGLPTNIKDGSIYTVRVRQDGTGSRALTYNAAFDFGDAGAPTLTTAANAYDYLTFVGRGTTAMDFLGATQGFT